MSYFNLFLIIFVTTFLKMLSKTCEYAIRAMIYVAQKSQHGEVVNIKEISKNIDSPELFIGKILQNLSRNGYIRSAKGRNGGFYLTDADARRSLADIVTAIDGDKIFTGCGLGLDYCSETKPCPIHNEYKETRNALYKIYKKATLQQFMGMPHKARLSLSRE